MASDAERKGDGLDTEPGGTPQLTFSRTTHQVHTGACFADKFSHCE